MQKLVLALTVAALTVAASTNNNTTTTAKADDVIEARAEALIEVASLPKPSYKVDAAYASASDPVARRAAYIMVARLKTTGEFRLFAAMHLYPAATPEGKALIRKRIELQRAILAAEGLWPMQLGEYLDMGGKFRPDKAEIQVLAGPVRPGGPGATWIERLGRLGYQYFTPDAREIHWGAEVFGRMLIAQRIGQLVASALANVD